LPHSIKPAKPRKPHADFPLFPHASGQWAKKIRQQIHYFGKWSDPQAALEKYLATKDDLQAGRTPRARKPEDTTVRDLVNAFLTHKQDLLTTGELCQRTFQEYHNTCERLVKAFGRVRPVDALVAEDFRHLRAQIARQWGPIRLSNEIQRVRSVLKYGFDAGLLDKPIRFGPDFRKPSAKVLRQNRAAAGPKMFEREELSAILAAAGPNMRAMILLAINGGLGNGDVAGLPCSAVNLDTGWLTYPRSKTGIERRIPLWPETVEAIKAAIHQRRQPKDLAHKNLVFVGPRGESYLASNGYRVAGEFIRLLTNAKIKQRGFYAIRHTFQTIGEGAHDLAAVQAIMGHAPASGDMSAAYRERIDDTRLVAVTEHVRKWLLGGEEIK
jgi:integrase